MTYFHFDDLRDKTIVITGTTRGIGKSILPGLLDQGMNLLLLNRNRSAMEKVCEELNADEGRIHLYDCDLTDTAQVSAVAQELAQNDISIDAILCNAAIDPRGRFEDGDEAFWQKIFQTNLFSHVTLTRHLIPKLRASGNGRIIFTGSVVHTMGGSFMTAYGSTKAALQGLTFTLSHELKHSGITVNCIVPGAITVEKEHDTSAVNQRVTNWQAVGRRLIPADILGPLCLFLSEASGGITGQALTIDGGLIHPLLDPDGQKRRLKMDAERDF